MENAFCYGVLILSVAVIIFIFWNGEQKRKRIREAKAAYNSSLEALKSDPGNADLKQKTLELGREYARVAREGGKSTLFDEMALMNDINAVAGSTPASTSGATKSASDRLDELQKMKDNGLITAEEYEAKRKDILDSM